MAAELTKLQALFRDAMDWGRSYGQRLNLTDMTLDDVSMGFAEKAAALATQGAEPECFGLRFPSDHKLCLSTIFDTEEEAKDYCEQCSLGTVVVPLYTAPPPTAEVEKKAARYDWLRALPLFGAWDVTRVRPNREWLIDSLRADDLDAAIDAALQSDQAQAGKGV